MIDINERLIQVILNNIDNSEDKIVRAESHKIIEETKDISKLQIDSVKNVKIIVDIEVEFDIEFPDDIYETQYFSFYDILLEYVEECTQALTNGEKTLNRINEMMKIQNQLIEAISNIYSSEDSEYIKIIGIMDPSNVSNETLHIFIDYINKKYEIDLNIEFMKQNELLKLINLSKFIFEKRERSIH